MKRRSLVGALFLPLSTISLSLCTTVHLFMHSTEEQLDFFQVLTIINKVAINILIQALGQFSHSVMSDSLWPHGLQYSRPPCPSPTPGVYSNSCPLSWWFHSTISSSVNPFSSCLQTFPSIRVFSNESDLYIRWPKYWSFRFSISPYNEHSGLISYMTDWLDLLAVRGTLKSLL